jgi:putative flippase GtrA
VTKPALLGGSARSLVCTLRTLRAPESGVLGQGVRFALVGALVAVVYLSSTTILAVVVGIPFQAALAAGSALALAVHFTLQRVFVWAHHEEYALPFHRQIGRYLLLTGTQYGITAASVALLPNVLGISTEIVYLATAILVASTNFLLFRNRIFHANSTVAAPAVKVA